MMTHFKAESIIETLAEVDFEHGCDIPSMSEASSGIEAWKRNPAIEGETGVTADDVREAVEVLGSHGAATAYREMIEELEIDSYVEEGVAITDSIVDELISEGK
jgi:hypothetical protein